MEWSNTYEVKQRELLQRTSTPIEMQCALHLLHARAAKRKRLSQRQFELGAAALGALACTLIRATRRMGSAKPSAVLASVSPDASV